MHTLIIRHLGGEGDRHRSQVWRPDGKVAEEVLLTAPDDIHVEGRPNSNLSLDLRWYLEDFLDYPFAPQTEVAERVQAALRVWGEQAFVALFHSGRGRDFYHDAYRNGLENLTVKIASDDPHLLAWPWEALRDPQTSGTLAHHARIERQLSGQHDPLDLPDQLPRDRINILLITARPYASDVGFRVLSRPMLDLIRQGNLPARVDLLRPPTLEQLRQHLQQRPHYYHIVHFDGHGGYGPEVHPDGYQLQGYQGRLIFETDTGEAAPIAAAQLSALLTEAVRAGRQAMLRHQGRICYRGEFPLEDWLAPVVYQQDPPDLPFAERAVADPAEGVALPPDVTKDDNPYGFIGRDSALLALERALRRPPAGVLIHGLSGIGKTTLAKGFLTWLADTGGLQAPPFWFSFHDIGSSAHVFNEVVASLFGTAAMAEDMEQKLSRLVQALKAQPFVIVWDNFESVSGIPGTEVQPRLPEPDRLQLRDFLAQLRGGHTKVIITSRSPETSWLPRTHCYRLSLGGLQGEERWTYCHAIVHDLGLHVNRDDPHLGELMDLLDGHPLAMRAMLTQLADRSAQALTKQLRHRLQQVEADDAHAKLFATLRFVEAALPEALKPLLTPLALHERFVAADILNAMAQAANAPQDRSAIDQMDQHGAALAQALAAYAQEQRDFVQAEQWYRKSLAIKEKQGNEYGAASTYHQLGMIAEEQRDFSNAGQCYIRSIVTFVRFNGRHSLQIAGENFLRCYAQAPPTDQTKLKDLWECAGLGPFPPTNAGE